MAKVKLGDIVWVDNKDRKFGSNTGYFAVWVKSVSGRKYPMILTQYGREDGETRAKYNMEDVPDLKVPFCERIIEWIKNIFR